VEFREEFKVRTKVAFILPLAALLLIAWCGNADGQGRTGMERVPGTMTGTVTDESGSALAGVVVKIFEEGMVLAQTTTEASGRYRLEFEFIPDIDWTLLTWFVSEDDTNLPQILILRESLKSKDLELWSPCLPRMELKARMKYDAVLLTEKTTLLKMSDLDCLKE
jgi:Carboxypeptidase regulatory-like domain